MTRKAASLGDVLLGVSLAHLGCHQVLSQPAQGDADSCLLFSRTLSKVRALICRDPQICTTIFTRSSCKYTPLEVVTFVCGSRSRKAPKSNGFAPSLHAAHARPAGRFKADQESLRHWVLSHRIPLHVGRRSSAATSRVSQCARPCRAEGQETSGWCLEQ